MQKNIIKYYVFSFFIIINIINPKNISATSEAVYFNKIKKLARANKHTDLEKTKWIFFKKFPHSKYIADVRFFSALLEIDPAKAIMGYRILIKNYKNFEKRDLVYLKLAELYSLIGQWKNASITCQAGLRSYPQSKYFFDIKYYLCYALYFLNQYEKCLKECNSLINTYNSSNKISEIKLLKIKIQYHLNGQSAAYVNDLISYSHNNKVTDMSSLYILAQYYQSKSYYSYAYSAYKDLIEKYPRSPEADMARLKIKTILKFNPKYTSEYHNKKISDINKDNLDISPEVNINDFTENRNTFYTVVIGPFYNLKRAEKLKNLFKKEFNPVIIIKKERSFQILVGQLKSTDHAATLKIRLAEEFAINGRILFIKMDKGRYYFYGD